MSLIVPFFMHCFHWNRPCNRLYDPRVGCKSRRVGRKSAGKWWVGYEIPDRTVKLQTGRNGHTDSCRVGDVFHTACRRTSTTSPKPLTDKPDHKQKSRKDTQTGLFLYSSSFKPKSIVSIAIETAVVRYD